MNVPFVIENAMLGTGVAVHYYHKFRKRLAKFTSTRIIHHVKADKGAS